MLNNLKCLGSHCGRVAVAVAIAASVVPHHGALAWGLNIFGPDWHEGPTGSDLESELQPRRHAAPNTTPAAIEAEARPAMVAQTLQVKRGDTMMQLLTGAGIARTEAHLAITALSEIYSPRKLKPGQEIQVQLSATDDAADNRRLLVLSLQPNVEQDVRVTRNAGQEFVAEAIERPMTRLVVSANGVIENNLSSAGRLAGLPMAVLSDLIHIFSFDVDFQREIQSGDSFEVLYQALFDESGALAKTDDVLYASLTLSGERLELYNFKPKKGYTDFFDRKGQSVRKTLMRTPIDGARLSSRFGMRRHPVLGYSKMHRGTDFAAPRGTPIYAAGDGVVEAAGRNGAYGKFVRIRHNSTYKTAYAHMSRIAKNVRRGKRVRQGQIIGYVGSTGRSTGPHLHYEVMRNGRQINPRKIKLPSGKKLKGQDLAQFQERREQIDILRGRARRDDTLMARADCLMTASGEKRPVGDGC